MKSAVTIADAGNLKNARDDIFDIQRVYARTLLDDPNRDKETEERQGYFHPSALAMCATRNVYEARREPFVSHLGVQDLEIFAQGHYVHDRVQTVLEKVDAIAKAKGFVWKFQREVPYNKKKDRLFADLRCGGTCDGEITIEKPGEWIQHGILEAKSMKDEYWQMLKGPKESHLLQAHLYAFRFDAPIIWFWYFNKNTGQHRVFPYIFDQKIFNLAVDRLVFFNEHLDAETLPPREESWYMCQRCEYQRSCEPQILKKPGQKKQAVKPSQVRRKGFRKRGER